MLSTSVLTFDQSVNQSIPLINQPISQPAIQVTQVHVSALLAHVRCKLFNFLIQCCFTTSEVMRLIRNGERPRTATSTLIYTAPERCGVSATLTK